MALALPKAAVLTICSQAIFSNLTIFCQIITNEKQKIKSQSISNGIESFHLFCSIVFDNNNITKISLNQNLKANKYKMNKTIYHISYAILKGNKLSSKIITNTKYGFSEQGQQKVVNVLKTYLEIIPPHEIHQIVEGREKKLQTLINNAEKVNMMRDGGGQAQGMGEQAEGQQQPTTANQVNSSIPANLPQQQQKAFKQLYKYIKKLSPYVPTPTLSKVVQVCLHKPSSQHPHHHLPTQTQHLKRKTYLKIIRQFKYKTQQLPLQQVVDFIYKLAKLNVKQHQVMKAAQNVIIEQKLHINYPMIRKILWAFTHLDVGSSVLYSHVSKTLKVGQFQLEPLELAQAAYMLSKVSENAKGGYGIFELAEKHIQANLSRMTFNQLTKASSYLLTQNIGSNKFQLRLQAQIYKKYPSKDKLAINEFLTLLKATSAYYFKFNDKALFNMLKTSTQREAKNATLQQFEDMVWSWGRLGKGDQQLWQCINTQIKRRINYLKPRQLAFFYHSLSSSSHPNPQTLTLLQTKFLSLSTPKTNQHYYIKMLLGMQKQKQYNTQTFLAISQSICSKINTLSKNELMAFFKVLNESDYDYTNKGEIEGIIDGLNEVGRVKLMRTIYTLKLSEITQMLYTYIKLQINNPQLINHCFTALTEVMSIPKQSFTKALFCFTIRDHYQAAYKMCIILQELLQYGPIGYFFSPYQFPLLAYCVVHLHYHSKGALEISSELLGQVKATVKEINPVILNDFVRKAYDETVNIINQHKHNKPTNKKSKTNEK